MKTLEKWNQDAKIYGKSQKSNNKYKGYNEHVRKTRNNNDKNNKWENLTINSAERNDTQQRIATRETINGQWENSTINTTLIKKINAQQRGNLSVL